MGNRSTRVLAAVAAGAMAGGLGLAGASAPQAARAPGGLAGGAAVRGTQLWVSRYNGPGGADDSAAAVAVGPDGKTVYVTGNSTSANGMTNDYATVAYQAGTGARLWGRRYNSPGNGYNLAAAMAVSPGGGRVFVTGTATVAYSTATGALLWVAHPGQSASSLAVSPDGTTVFVTGEGNGGDDATAAYSAATGARLWTKPFNSHRNDDTATSVTVSPSGTTVFVTGTSDHNRKGHSNPDYATAAYNAATGTLLWASRYNGPGNSSDEATSVTASPSGRTVFVTGEAATVAYRAANGDRLWASRYHGPGNSGESAVAVVAGPDGKTVFVTGTSFGAVTSHEDWATIAYSAATGAQRWASRHNGPTSSDDRARSLALSPDGKTVYVTGYSSLSVPNDRYPPTEYVTIAYRTATGARLWARHYQNDAAAKDSATSVAVSPAGTVFVTGSSSSANATRDLDYATIAYRG
jgi:WD40 repeat protein